MWSLDTNDHADNLRQFIPIPGTHVFVTEAQITIEFDDTNGAPTPAPKSLPGLANALRPDPDPGGNDNGQNIFIQTGTDGEAQVYLRLGEWRQYQ